MQAFGTGALEEEEDEDIYGQESLTTYDTALALEGEVAAQRTYGWTGGTADSGGWGHARTHARTHARMHTPHTYVHTYIQSCTYAGTHWLALSMRDLRTTQVRKKEQSNSTNTEETL